VTKEPPKFGSSRGDTPGLDAVLERNIQTLIERRKEEAAAITKHQGFATAIGRFIGSFGFVYTHLALFGLWVFVNTAGLPGVPVFDPELFYMATFAAVEAIFLTTLCSSTRTGCRPKPTNGRSSIFRSTFSPSTS
jgi:hypothetical protein